MKRTKIAHKTSNEYRETPREDDSPKRRKLTEEERNHMQVDDDGWSLMGGRRKIKNIPKPKPRPRYIPCAPPNLECLDDGAPTSGISCAKHIEIEFDEIQQGPIMTTVARAKLVGHTSTPLLNEMQTTNPHWGVTPREAESPATTIPFTEAALPKLVYKCSTLLGNVRSEVKDGLERARDKAVMILPMGAGNRFTRDNPRYAEQILEFIRSLKGANDSKITIAPPAYQFEPPQKARFTMPFAYIVTNTPKPVQDLLIRRQTFAFLINGKSYAFNAAAVPDGKPSLWVIANFTGDCVTDKPDNMKNTLEAIITKLFDSDTITRMINEALARKGVGTTVYERKVIALSSMSLAFMPRRMEGGDSSPVWQLSGRPVHDNAKDHRTWLKAIRREPYDLGNMKTIRTTKDTIGCVWCKAETHASESCPLPNLHDWKGPTPDKKEWVKPEPHYTPDAGRKEHETRRKGKKGKKNRAKDRAVQE